VQKKGVAIFSVIYVVAFEFASPYLPWGLDETFQYMEPLVRRCYVGQGSVQLFLERALAMFHKFVLTFELGLRLRSASPTTALAENAKTV
jgi:hypothetical protein